MSEPQVIEELRELGLTEYQSGAYLAAVKLGRARPTDLAEESGVPQARIYDVIDDLKSEGLVEVHSQARGKEITAPSPQTVLNQLKRRRIDDLSETVSTAVSELEGLYHRTEENPDAFVTMVEREDSAMRHARQAIADAEWWLTLSIDVTRYPDLRSDIEDALDRNVTVRLLLFGDEAIVSGLDFDERLRVHHRTTADTFIAADRSYGVFSSKHPARSGQPYIITQERNLVLLFQNYSEQIWPASTVVQRGSDGARRYLDPWHAITDLESEFEAGTDLYATVRGIHTERHRQGSWEGEIVDYEITGPMEVDYSVAVPQEASLTIDTGDGIVTVGGWKATIEDIAAEGVEITRL